MKGVGGCFILNISNGTSPWPPSQGGFIYNCNLTKNYGRKTIFD